MEKTITCAECNVNYTYTPNPDYPDKRKYCALCSAKKQEQWEKKDEPKETVHNFGGGIEKVTISTMPISEQRVIVRQSSIKSAVEFHNAMDKVLIASVLDVAETFENWVFR